MRLEDFKELTLQEDGLNINISAYRLLYIYLLLSQSEQISFEDLNTHLLNHPLIQRTFTTETLNKYMNTLRLFGCVIKRFEEQGHLVYRLEEHPLKRRLLMSEIKALKNTAELLSLQPLTTACKNFYFLIKRLSIIPNPQEFITNPQFESILHSRLCPQSFDCIERFQKYCLEGQILEICYENEDNFPILTLVEPQEVVYHKKRFYLVGNDPKTNKKARYEVDRIRSHRQLPSRVRSQTVKTTVTFKLTGRVALNYRPYPQEMVWNKGEFLLVKHTTDEVEQLLKRLLKYGSQCQVVSPGFVRDEMLKLIQQLEQPLNVCLEDVIQALVSKGQKDETLRKWVCYLDTPQT